MVGGPVALYNLFNLIDPNTFVALTIAKTIRESPGVKENWLPCKYYFADSPGLSRDGLAAQIAAASAQKEVQIRPGLLRRVTNTLLRLTGIDRYVLAPVRFLSTVYDLVSLGLRVIRAEKVETIMALSDDGPAMLAVALLHRITRRPFVLYFFDLYRGNAFTTGRKLIARLLEPWLFSNCEVVISTNDLTNEYFEKRYGRTFTSLVIGNSVTISSPVEKPRSQGAPFLIVYTGMAYWPQSQSILNLVRAMELLRDLPLELKLFIPNLNPELEAAIARAPNTTLSSVPQSQIAAIQAEATLLFLPFSWNTPAPDIIATATPMKFTTYLTSGRPMLVHAPPEACVSRLARKHGLGLIVDANEVSVLAGTIRDALSNPGPASETAQRGRQFAEANLDASINAAKLVHSLNNTGGL